MTVPALKTRKPTGETPWPILCIAGAEKTGKSWSCAVASSSDLIDRTLWVGIGEDDPDEYGRIPGARFEIVEHDGTYRGILGQLQAAAALPVGDRPNLLVIDSGTRLWELLCDMAQREANQREARKRARANKPPSDEDVQITMDLWNVAKDRWQNVLDVLREHQGPSIITARLDEVTVLDGSGRPTQQKTLKVKAEKGLPYDVGATVQMPERGKAYLVGVRTTRMEVPDRMPLPGFTVDKLWRDLGLAAEPAGERRHSGANAQTDQAWLASWNRRLDTAGEDDLPVLWDELVQVRREGDLGEDDALACRQAYEAKATDVKRAAALAAQDRIAGGAA